MKSDNHNKKSSARLFAVQILFEMEINGKKINNILERLTDEYLIEISRLNKTEKADKNHLIKDKKFIWDKRWLISFKSEVQSEMYIKPYGLLSFDDHKFCIHGDFDKGALATIPVIIENRTVKFVPVSNLTYDVEVKLLNEEKEFYKFF